MIDSLIAFLTDLKGMSLITRVLTLLTIPSLLAIPIWLMTRKVRASVVEYDILEAQLKTARGEAAKIEKESADLKAKSPATFIADHTREMTNGNDERAMALAEGFLDQQSDALSLAFRSRMDEAIRQSVTDGAPAFANARHWARAARALEPDDRDLRMLIDELDAAEAAAASGAQVELTDDTARAEQAKREDRLPTDLGTLERAFYKERHNGHYRLMLFLAGHGLTLTKRRPFGEGSREHLMFRRHRAEALAHVGQLKKALAEVIPLGPSFKELYGERDSKTLYTRHLISWCREYAGDAARALDELLKLLPLRIDVEGKEHREVLMTRKLIAQCRDATGDTARALEELEDLLPIETKVRGPQNFYVFDTRLRIAYYRRRTGDAKSALKELEELLRNRKEVQDERHPAVLQTQFAIAQCRQDLGDINGALAELADLLPRQAEAVGAHHPSVLRTRTIYASCLLDAGQRAEAGAMIDGVRAGFEAAGLLPQHRAFLKLEEVEAQLAG